MLVYGSDELEYTHFIVHKGYVEDSILILFQEDGESVNVGLDSIDGYTALLPMFLINTLYV